MLVYEWFCFRLTGGAKAGHTNTNQGGPMMEDNRKVRWRRISDSYPAVKDAHSKQEEEILRLETAIASLRERVVNGQAEQLHQEQLRRLEFEHAGRFHSYAHLDRLLSGDETFT